MASIMIGRAGQCREKLTTIPRFKKMFEITRHVTQAADKKTCSMKPLLDCPLVHSFVLLMIFGATFTGARRQ